MYPATWVLAIANLAMANDRGTWWYLYLGGLVASIAHMAWGPRAKDLMDGLAAMDGKTKAGDDDGRSLRGHEGVDASECYKECICGLSRMGVFLFGVLGVGCVVEFLGLIPLHNHLQFTLYAHLLFDTMEDV
ncbi:hypothetical protein B0H63DRAFT_155284 [Podospora didyma]|uniref:Uncharacterized protein n=1 Tax=Podospora didyma TaxID=330526 RepID=A0AAE0NT71_9PEZI|nr:hypothetical protein B0H63DRAFT_155284 [Podospora didyma]